MTENTQTEQPDAQVRPMTEAEPTVLPLPESEDANAEPEGVVEAYQQYNTDGWDIEDDNPSEKTSKNEKDIDLIIEDDDEVDVSRYDNDDEVEEIDLSRFDNVDDIDLIAHKSVLLVEDERDVADLITKHLKSMKVRDVNVVNNVGAAYFLITRDKELFPDIVLLELALPGTDGIQLLARLRAHKDPAVQNLPAVVITMLESPGIYRRAARQRVGAFLKKPISKDGLRAGMEAALRGEIVEKPFSQPKSWLDEFEEEELLKKQEEIKARVDAKIAKKGLLVRVFHALIPWSGK